MLKVALVVCLLAGVALAAQGRAPLEDKPAKFKDQEGCYIKDLDAVVPTGQRVPSKSACQEYVCTENLVLINSCGVLVAPPEGTIQDQSKPYPDCCPQPRS